MRKLLRTQDILLLGLSGVLDLFEEIRDPLNIVSSSYKAMYGWVPEQYKKNNFNHLVWRNIRTGFIEKVEKNGEVYIRLTPQGGKRIARDFPVLSLQKRKWDRKWRVVIFDIEEVNRNIRDRLRKKLRELGFGMIQESVFISPHDIIQDLSEFIERCGLSEVAYVFEASSFASADLKKLANKVWGLDKLNEKYKEVLDEIEAYDLTDTHDRVKSLNSSREIRNKYLSLLLQDPFLPRELLPDDWQGEKARILVKGLRKIIDL